MSAKRGSPKGSARTHFVVNNSSKRWRDVAQSKIKYGCLNCGENNSHKIVSIRANFVECETCAHYSDHDLQISWPKHKK